MKQSQAKRQMKERFYRSKKPSKTKSRGVVCVKQGNYGSVFDGNGIEIIQPAWANLRTGWAINYVLDAKGCVQLDPKDDREVWTRKRRYPYPLKFKKMAIK